MRRRAFFLMQGRVTAPRRTLTAVPHVTVCAEKALKGDANHLRVLLQDAAWFYNSSPKSFLDGVGNRFSMVDRAGHLQGAMFGVVYVLARGLFRFGSTRPSAGTGSSTRLV